MSDPEPRARADLRRSMVIYIALLIADVAIVVFIFASGPSGVGYATASIVAAVGLLLTYHVLQHIQDLGSPLAETAGVVRRKWRRADLVIAWHSYYIQVDRAIFKLKPEDYIAVDEEMHVSIVHFPRTLAVVSIHRSAGAATPPLPPPSI